MKIFLLLMLAVHTILPSASYGGYFQSTTTWIARCEKPIENSDEQTAESMNVADELSPCYAYLMAIADALDATILEARKSVGTNKLSYWQVEVCISSTADQESLRQAFLEYAEQHPYPQLTGTNPAYVVADAFATKWPCGD